MTRTSVNGVPGMDEDKRLRRNKAAATGMLGGMAAALAFSWWLPPSMASGFLEASARAGLVGGLADWFAVTALFRHPLGLPIPHTALVPANQERLGHALADFVCTSILTDDEVEKFLSGIDVSSTLSRLLADEDVQETLKSFAADVAPHIMRTIGDVRVLTAAKEFMPNLANGSTPSLMAARLLGGMLATGKHKPVLRLALVKLRAALQARQGEIKAALNAGIRTQGGTMIGWLAGDRLGNAVVQALDTELDENGPLGGALQEMVEAWLREEIYRLQTDPMRAYQVGDMFRSVLSSPEVSSWLGDVWKRAKVCVDEDAAKPGGTLRKLVSEASHMASAALTSDTAKQRVQTVLASLVKQAMPSLRKRLSEFLSSVVSKWDADTLVHRLEMKVGPDLQFIRISGTVIGFLAGGVLYGLMLVTGGQGHP